MHKLAGDEQSAKRHVYDATTIGTMQPIFFFTDYRAFA